MDGSWHGAQLDEFVVPIAGVRWIVALHGLGFQVTELDGKSALSLPEGKNPISLTLASSGPAKVEFGGDDHLRYARTGDTLHGEFQHGDAEPQGFDLARVPEARSPELEAVELAFAADSKAHGADAWMRVVSPRGALWRSGKRIEGEAVRAAVAPMLAGGTLTWAPVTSGVRGDFGFTAGTYDYATPTGTHATGSYCTIWVRDDGGGWKLLFDLGS